MKKGPDVSHASGPASPGAVLVEISVPSFVANLLVCLVPSLLVSGALTAFFSVEPAAESVAIFTSDHWVGVVFLVCIFAPLVENCLLLYPAHLLSQAVRPHGLVCLIAAAPVVLIHAYPHNWGKSLAVAWPFIWLVHCFLVLKAKGIPIQARFWFIFCLHSGVNAALVGIVHLAKLML